MPKRESRTKYAVLGLLSLRSSSGYGLKKQLERELMFFWNESFGQIYPTLRSLVADGLATVESIERVGPDEVTSKHDRKIYTITDQGRQALASWLRKPPNAHPSRNETLLKVFLGASTTHEICQAHIHQMRHELIARRDALAQERQQMQGSDGPHTPFQLLTLTYGEQMTAAALAWCDQALEQLSTEQS